MVGGFDQNKTPKTRLSSVTWISTAHLSQARITFLAESGTHLDQLARSYFTESGHLRPPGPRGSRLCWTLHLFKVVNSATCLDIC